MKGYITITKAMEISVEVGFPVTRATVIAWVRKFGLGKQPGGKWGDWYVHEKKWREFLEGERSSHAS